MNDLPKGDREESETMRFEPKTREQIQEEKVLPDGEYAFEVSKALDTTSKKGNDMIALHLTVFTTQNEKRTVRDWLLDNMPEKMLGFCEATGLTDIYMSGVMGASDCMGASGYLKLKVEDSDQYGPQNKVSYYVPRVEKAKPGKPSQVQEPVLAGVDDDCPF